MVYMNGFELNGLKTSIENMCSLRSCKILIENYFCISHKNKRKRNQEIKLLFNKIIYFLAHVRKLILLLINNIYGSIYPEMLLRKVVPKICRKCTGEHQCQSVISIKLLCDVIEIALWHGCSPVNLLHVFRTPFTRNILGWLRLYLFGYLLPRNVKETHTDQITLQCFYSVWKEKSNKPIKVATAKHFLPGAYVIVKTCFDPENFHYSLKFPCFDECFLLHVITTTHTST